MGQPIDRAFVEILPDVDEFSRDLERKLDDVFDDFEDRVEQVVRRVEDDFEDMASNIVDSIDDAVDRMDRDLDTLDGREVDIQVDIDDERVNKRLDLLRDKLLDFGKKITTGSLKVTAFTAAFLALSGVLANLVGGLGGFLAALTPVFGIFVALPAVVAGVVIAMKTVTLAVQGVGDALKAGFEGDAEKFAEALEELSPAAQRFTKSLVALKPQLDAIGDAVQERFFAPFADDMDRLAKQVLPVILAELPKLADALGGVANQFGVAIEEGTLLKGLVDVVRGLDEGFTRLKFAVVPLSQALGTLFSVGAKFLPDLIGGIGSLAQSFAKLIADLNQAGRLEEIFQNAIDTIAQLGRILGQVFSIVNSIFGAMNAGAGSTLDVIERILTTFANFLDSAEGATGLLKFFEILNTLGDAVSESLGIALIALSGAFKALAPAAGPLGDALVAIVNALAPLLPLLGSALALAITELSGLFKTLAIVLGPVISLFSVALSKAFVALLPAVTQIVDAFGPLAGDLGKGLLRAFVPLAELISVVAKAFVDSLLPQLPRLIDAFTELIPIITDLATQFSDELVDVILELIPQLPDLVVAFVDLAVAMTQLAIVAAPVTAVMIKILGFLANLTFGFGPLIVIVKAFTAVVDALSGVFDFFINTVGPNVTNFFTNTLPNAFNAVGDFFTETVPGWIDTVVDFFKALPGRIGAALAALPEIVLGIVNKMLDDFLFRVGVVIGLIIFNFTEMPNQVVNAIKSLGPKLLTFFENLFNAWRTKTSQSIEAVLNFFRALPQRISGAISSIGNRIQSTFTSAFSRARSTVTSGVNAIISGIASLPSRISAFAGRIGSAASSLGRAIGNGLANIGGFAADIGRRIVNTVRSGVNRVIGSINRGLASIDAVLPGSLPRLPFLARGGVALGPAIAGEDGKEVVLPLESERTRKLLESVLPKGLGGGVVFGPGAVQVMFQGVVPTELEALNTGRAVGAGIVDVLARRNAKLSVRQI